MRHTLSARVLFTIGQKVMIYLSLLYKNPGAKSSGFLYSIKAKKSIWKISGCMLFVNDDIILPAIKSVPKHNMIFELYSQSKSKSDNIFFIFCIYIIGIGVTDNFVFLYYD